MKWKPMRHRDGGHPFLWWPELLACLFSMACIVALVALLTIYNERQIFNWHGVTLNALVSVLSTASKASLLLAVEEAIGQWKWLLFWGRRRRILDFDKIDNASRGPLGSVSLFWGVRGRYEAAHDFSSMRYFLAFDSCSNFVVC